MKILFKLLAVSFLFIIAISCKKNMETNPEEVALRKGNGTGPVRWWRHNNLATNSCTGSGIYCFDRKFMNEVEIANYKPSEEDEILTETTILLKGDQIQINSVGVKGSLSASTLAAFKAKRVEAMGSYISEEKLKDLFKSINLTAPADGHFIKPEEQSYKVYDAKYEGKNTEIVEAQEETKINLSGKIYTLTIVTASSKSDKK